MRTRYEAWVEGLTGDWNISRQRYFGVPFPVWYAVRADGVDRRRPPDPRRGGPAPPRPVDRRPRRLPGGPARRAGRLRRRPRRDGHLGDVVAHPAHRRALGRRPDLFARIFPMDLRPQAHEIIRTWLFSSVVRSELEHGCVPWSTRRDLRVDPRPGPQEDLEVEGQRRRAERLARRPRDRRRPLLGGVRPPRRRHHLRRPADEDRPAARHQDPERDEVRPAARLDDARDRRPTPPSRRAIPSTWRCWTPGRASSPRRPTRSRTTSTPGRSSGSSTSSGPSVTTTSSS